MTAVPETRRVSISEYLDGEERSGVKHEYIGGTVHAMAGATVRHNRIAMNAGALLFNHVRGHPCEAFNSDMKVRIERADHTRFYYPDAMVVCDSNPPDDRFQDRPVIIVEVLSDSTRRTDLGEKLDAYLAIPSLKAVLFIESGSSFVLVYRRRPEGGFAAEEHSGTETVIPLPEIEAELPLAELYDRIEFPAS